VLYKTLSAAVYGIDASLIEVEVDVAPIKQEHDTLTTVGLPDTTVRENTRNRPSEWEEGRATAQGAEDNQILERAVPVLVTPTRR